MAFITKADYIGTYYDDQGPQEVLIPKGTSPSVNYTDTSTMAFIFEDGRKYGFKVDTPNNGVVFVPAEIWEQTTSFTIAGKTIVWQEKYWLFVAAALLLLFMFHKELGIKI